MTLTIRTQRRLLLDMENPRGLLLVISGLYGQVGVLIHWPVAPHDILHTT